MSNELIRQQTASEPLTLEEEYEMQRSWQEDEDKLTFIVLAKNQGDNIDSVEELLRTSPMAGDVNLFLSQRLDFDDERDEAFDAELEVMIAESQWRHKGLGMEALSLMIHYASTIPTPAPVATATTLKSSECWPSKYLPLSRSAFLAKIGYDNDASIRLFEKLGFQQAKRRDVWREVEMRPRREGLSLGPPLDQTAVHYWALSS